MLRRSDCPPRTGGRRGYPFSDVLFAAAIPPDAPAQGTSAGAVGWFLALLVGGALVALLVGFWLLRQARRFAAPDAGSAQAMKPTKRLDAWAEAGKRATPESAPPDEDDEDGPGPWGAP